MRIKLEFSIRWKEGIEVFHIEISNSFYKIFEIRKKSTNERKDWSLMLPFIAIMRYTLPF